jgi:hypothetical protein
VLQVAPTSLEFAFKLLCPEACCGMPAHVSYSPMVPSEPLRNYFRV